jgi:hypothetical protein
MKMQGFEIDQKQVAAQTAQNLVEAGELEPEDYEQHVRVIQGMPFEEALKALIQSHNIREESGRRVNFYPINIQAIGRN